MPADADAPEVLFDFLRTMNPGRTHEKWRWKFRGSPGGGDVILAHLDVDLIGTFSITRMPFQYGQNAGVCAKGASSLMDRERVRAMPEDSDRQVYLLVRTAMNRAHETGIAVIFGMANKYAHAAQVRTGFKLLNLPLVSAKCVFSMSEFARGGRGRRRTFARLVAPAYEIVASIALGILARGDPLIRPVTSEHAEAWEDLANALGRCFPGITTTRRDWPYIEWLCARNPYRPCEAHGLFDEIGNARGLIVLNIEERDSRKFGEIMDVVALDERTMAKLIRFGLWWLRSKGAISAEVWTARDLPANRLLGSCLCLLGFWLRSREPREIIVYSTIGDGPYDVANWYVTRALRLR